MININHNTNKISTEKQEKPRLGFLCEKFNLKKTTGTPAKPEIGHEIETNGGRMINKWAHKTLHQLIETLNIGRLVSYEAETVQDLQSRGSETQIENECDRTAGVRSSAGIG